MKHHEQKDSSAARLGQIRAESSPKPYKSQDPFTTINQIRAILEECGIFTAEYPYPPADFFHSSGLFLSDHKVGDLQVGFYGKGMNHKYSLASAYAEFMERLQNGVLFATHYASLYPLKKSLRSIVDSLPGDHPYRKRMERDDLKLDFVFAPDEESLGRDVVLERNRSVLAHIFKTDALERVAQLLPDVPILCAPFYNATEGAVETLPIELIFRASVSNGMCAGNTPEEAILHGICEVFERYAVYQIYTNEITPPTIPLAVFEHTEIAHQVQFLENMRNLKIVIKDCSLEQNLPVMGVLAIDQLNHRYTFNLGADPSPVIAVERCLMEMYQGGPNIHYTPLQLHRDPFAASDDLTRSQQKSRAFYENLFTGTGAWPNAIFDSTPSYPFSGFGFPEGQSDAEDMRTGIDLAKRLGFDVYVRDCSFLGFPTYLVYIPGMSEGKYGYSAESVAAMCTLEQHLDTLHDLGGSQQADLGQMVDALHTLSQGDLPFEFEFKKALLRSGPTQFDQADSDILFAVLCVAQNELDRALEYIDRFLNRKQQSQASEKLAYLGLRDLITLKQKQMSDSDVKELIAILYGGHAANAIWGEYINAGTVFQQLPIPACFNCDRCHLQASCAHFDILKIVKTVQQRQKERPIAQADLAENLVAKHQQGRPDEPAPSNK